MFWFPLFLAHDFVSFQFVCNGLGQIVRYHPSGLGYGSPWTFIVFAEFVGDGWKLAAAWGTYSVLAHRRIRRALSAAGMPAVKWERDPGTARERELSVQALPH